MIKVVFFGTEQFAVSVLQSLLKQPNDFNVLCAVTQPPRPVGRKQIVTPSPVARVAEEGGIEIFTPTTLKKTEVVEYLKKFNADVFVVAQYGLIIPTSILEIAPHGCVNVHGSLLPKYRGA
ncbi:MAG: methionyl-tRNA formyltransferase, partial [Candidatus Magasanikbacteria bacterium]|nr:methionyl-tRNA formyltransferase [Candidatus Magasanikbacteria bacterium]